MPSYVVLAKLVKVTFVLQRRCEFGQQFFVVGDDELVGAWNPEAALPMQWSEGHIWTAEQEVSRGKHIEFKVILVGDEGVLEWQPGPNCVLETMESLSPLEILETWSGEDQDDTFSGLEMNELSDMQNVSLDSVMNVGGMELPVPVVDSEAVWENIETTVDGVLSGQSIVVKFVLQKRCEFGQQFFVVGDDESVGAWNPVAALPMQWSEGHIWTAELEVSRGKRIEFKVILVGDEGVLEWQPGPNRVLETMESLSPLLILVNELSDIQNLFPDSVMNVGGMELPVPVVDSEAVWENIETTVDGALSD